MCDEMMNRFALKMKVKRINCSVVYQCAMFRGILKKKGLDASVIQGYCLVQDSACRHYWVECDGKKYDVARKVSSLFNDELNLFNVFLTLTIPEDSKRLDEGEEIVNQNESEYAQFVKNPAVFWASAPMCVKNAHIKI